ncbi:MULTISPECIES: NAD(P)H-dependent oxidoreductase [Pseudonocardia]|uniref:Homoserine dehydrogenase n=2 Tax=Pseudonocardia TaxID=1847 RepID=A0A1Y2N9S8_PSEAH|nr:MULTISPECIES: SAF domain-containing protein [Pseudonocardia]OSY43648.1 homoserine dehydrogenase [Pseudonocardia autotrophica]TDN73362.1 putative homoserine dehydrogenase-like protein [Pseudonocardia autotrophica]BBG04100.1 strU protein [Pseudonocardia autotrophica]GEC26237.1 strU protein [Pseudonocardia saturnea]
MLILDTALAKRAAENRPIRVGLVGAGFMGRGLVNQIVNSTPGMDVVAIANRTVPTAARAYTEAGLEPVEVSGTAEVEAAIAKGTPAVLGDAFALLAAENIDVLVDVTGAVEFGARVTVAAIERGLPVVTMNAELDGTVGPLLAEKARQAGVVLTGADGDQPGVQANLLRFVKGIGITPLVAGNIKGLQDEYRNPTTQKGFAEKWGQDPYMVTSFADGTKVSFEQAIVANAFGFTVGKRGMYGRDHAGHVDELTGVYDVEELRELGGVVDYVVGAKPGPGIYVLGTHDDPKQQHYLNLYKLGEGPLYSFYTPYHLCHFEVPNTIVRAVDFADAALTPPGAQRVDVVATAKRDLKAGHTLDGLGGYDSYGVAEASPVTRSERLLPMGVAEGGVLTRDVAKDEVLTYDDVTLPPGRLIDVLREEQVKLFS